MICQHFMTSNVVQHDTKQAILSEQGRLSLFPFSVQKVANHGQAAPNERLRTLSYLRGGIQLNDVMGMLK